ncbi:MULTISPECIES: DUF3016 domain-containing protein [Gammaproteobacteria]|uniref:DUF3016 domain-containing protein n=1 Tax=Gammaproteobacteria TaxID=1236 RepID=UPI000DD01121|nr:MULTISPECIES: DUF3016 domain-containing protein [Gammaproteobacteria]RTE85684.1 DUF3016 domain-containing protein [Aliidiomarina sp. B3213]TCZ90314.1 DUF3016 domain-containing protein [Lysobacter sp. N42]
MNRIIAVLMLGLAFAMPAQAGEASVTWENPDSYRDIRAAEELQSRFEERVFAEFERHFAELAGKLPDGQKLHITVTNLDLAGEVLPNQFGGSMNMVRVVRNSDFPSMEFNYRLESASGETLASGQERLRGRDMPGQGSSYIQGRSQHEMLDYERAMLDRWFYFRFEQ